MAVSNNVNKFRYEGNGVTTTFAFNGRIFSDDDVIVEIITRATDVLVETLAIGDDYTVTINGDESASVVVESDKIPTVTQDIQVRRALTQTQSVNLPTGTVFPAQRVEDALDRSIAISQDLSERLDRTLTRSPTASGTVPSIGTLVSGELISYNGTEIVSSGGTAEGIIADTETARDEAVAAFDDFDTRYLGAKASDPTLDNNGDPLETGALYFNTVSDSTLVYSGSNWLDFYAEFYDFISGIIESPKNESYTLVIKAPYAGTITETTTKSASGTCTATFKVNTTALGGTANSVSSSEQSRAHSTTNTFIAGDDILITISSNSLCKKMSFTIKFVRNS